jgi:hypothetical protein
MFSETFAHSLRHQCVAHSRDILNHRYFDKRKLYLLGLYQCLVKHSGAAGSLFSGASFAAFKGDHRKPILELRAPFSSSRAGSGGVVMRIIPVVSQYNYCISKRWETQ